MESYFRVDRRRGWRMTAMSEEWNTVRIRLARERVARAVERAAAAAERAAEVHANAAIEHERHARIAAEMFETMQRTMATYRGRSDRAQHLRAIAERERARANLEHAQAGRERAIADRLAPGTVVALSPRADEPPDAGGGETAEALSDG